MIGIQGIHGLTLVAAMGVAAGSLALGSALLRRLRITPTSSLLNAVTAWAIGLGLLGQIWLLLGLMQLYRPAIGWACLGFTLLIGVAELIAHRAAWRHFVRKRMIAVRQFTTVEVYLLLTTAVLAGLSFAGAFLPPYSLDVIKYHMAAPAQYLEAGGIGFIPHFFFQQPYGGAAFNAWSLLLGLENLGAVINGFCAPAVAAALYGGGRRYMPRAAALLAALLFYVLPGAWDYSYAHMPDLGLFLFTLIAFFSFQVWAKSEDFGVLAVAGLAAGFAAAYKSIGLYIIFATVAMVLAVLLHHRPGWRRSFTALAVLGCAMFFAGGTWYLRNWIVAGNPVWPVFFDVLGGKCWNQTAYEDGLRNIEQGYSFVGRSPLAFLLGPIGLLIGYVREPVFSLRPGLGPLFALFVPAALVITPLRQRHGWLWVFVTLYYVAWFPFSQYGRFFLPAYVLLLLPLADAVVWLAGATVAGWRRLAVRAVPVVTAGWIILVVLWLGGRTLLYLPAVIGLETRDEFLGASTSYYADIQWMNQHLPSDAVVLSEHIWLYYLDRVYLWNSRGLQGYFDYATITSQEAIRDTLSALGVTHVFVQLCPGCPQCTGCYTDQARQLFHRYLQNEAERIYLNETAVVPVSIARRTKMTVPVAIYELPSFPANERYDVCRHPLAPP